MYAIIRSGGKQYRVQQGDRLVVEKLPGQKGDTIDLSDVLAVGEGESLKLGTPLVAGAKVTATITEQGKGPKLIIFKKRRRKDFRNKKGHRQSLTELKIQAISG